METIHTDAAYKALSRKNSGRLETQMSLDQSVLHAERRTFINVNDGDEMRNINAEVICFYLPFCTCVFVLISVYLSLTIGKHTTVAGSTGWF